MPTGGIVFTTVMLIRRIYNSIYYSNIFLLNSSPHKTGQQNTAVGYNNIILYYTRRTFYCYHFISYCQHCHSLWLHGYSLLQ